MNLILKFLYHTSYSTFHENESVLKFPKLISFHFRNSRPKAGKPSKVKKLVLWPTRAILDPSLKATQNQRRQS